jgi:hypothetical protein
MAQKPKAPKTSQPKKRDLAQANVRLDPKLVEAVRHFAAWHGMRSFNREVEIALECHTTRSMLVALDHPGFVAELKAADPDFDLDAFRAQTMASLDQLEAWAYSRPPQLDELVDRLQP